VPSIEHQGLRIFFEDLGSGTPLILGHSFLCSGEMWAHQVQPLAERARVINVDFRGHGRSDHVQSPFDLYDLVADMMAVLDHLGLERAVWVGLSIGGMVALRAALEFPDRVSGLILLDTHAGPEKAHKKTKYALMKLVVKVFGVRPLRSAILPLMFGRTSRQTKPDLIDEWTTKFAAVHVPSMLHCLGALTKRDSVVDRLGQIKAPAVVMVGDQDISLPPPCAEQIASGLPDAELVVIPNAGHLAALEQPEAVNKAMLDFLDSLHEGESEP
jgi:pimeloyl-ACP methyl ester carboxylesterase